MLRPRSRRYDSDIDAPCVLALRHGPRVIHRGHLPDRPREGDTVRSVARAPVERKQSLQSLERGIAVLQVFSRERPALTLSEIARLTGITRATARRILLTLEKLG